MQILINFLLAIYVLVALLMLLVILMQRPKSEGLGAAFGGGELCRAPVKVERRLGLTDVLQPDREIIGIVGIIRLQVVGLEIGLLRVQDIALLLRHRFFVGGDRLEQEIGFTQRSLLDGVKAHIDEARGL